MSSEKKCKEDKEINPFTGRCYPKCFDGTIRFIDIENKKFSCKTPVNLEKEVFELEMAELELIKRGLMKEKSASASAPVPAVSVPVPVEPAVSVPVPVEPAVPVPAEPVPSQTIDKNIRDCPPKCSKGYTCDKKSGKCKSNTPVPKPIEPAPVPKPIEPAPAPVPKPIEPAPAPAPKPIEPAPAPAPKPSAPVPKPSAPVEEKEKEEESSDILLFGDKSYKKNNEKNKIMELKERTQLSAPDNIYDNYLYPNLNDPKFNIKIAEKKEFNDTQYDGKIMDVEKQAEILCNADYELAPHQLFVRNFLSFQTPYNSLLLYHGLGTGKTCSAISVSEEMRDYLTQMGITSKIIVVASPNVQDNFKLQLFDEQKLQLVDGMWNIRACTGNKFLKEINPMNMKGLIKENVIIQIKSIIHKYYEFFGYTEFANYIIKISELDSSIVKTNKERDVYVRRKLQKHFNNRLVIIDEVHNIRISDDNKNKRTALELFKLVQNVNNLRLLLLSATPMYNSYKEIIWLINLMNLNDGRPTIDVKDVFNNDGMFKTDKAGNPIGKDLLERKATGYISFVRGENPYTFPYRVWPQEFAKDNTFTQNEAGSYIGYPRTQLNNKPVIQPIEFLSLYLTTVGDYQNKGYTYIMNKLKKNFVSSTKIPTFENMESFGFTLLQKPLEALNIVYPDERLDTLNDDFSNIDDIKIDTNQIVGEAGLFRIMDYECSPSPCRTGEEGKNQKRFNFKYKNEEKYGRIFSPSEIKKYSSKISSVCQQIMKSKGVVLVYARYISGGILPIALALEELGFTRARDGKSLFEKAPTEPIDAITLEPKSKYTSTKPFQGAKYTMITGDKGFTPDSVADIKMLTMDDNADGSKIKVVLISQAGSEGVDLKFIRQVHIIDPWYNMNRIEQIIGRAVRNCSHKKLPFSQRNVEIYLYGTLLKNDEEESADLYVYRLAELKAVQIGNISRVLKSIAVDCILNYEQTGFTITNMKQTVRQELSSGLIIEDYQIGDKEFSSTCDYMKKCEYYCNPAPETATTSESAKLDTYNETFIIKNTDKVINKIKMLMKDKFFYRKSDLITRINMIKSHPLSEIDAALTQLVDDKYEFLTDKYGRLGNLVNVDDLYLFQPTELTNTHISLYERETPIDYKRDSIKVIESSVAGPSVAGPSVAGPSVAGPSVAGPSVAGPSVAGPSVAVAKEQAGPSVAGPSVAVAKEQAGPSVAAKELADTSVAAKELASAVRAIDDGETLKILDDIKKNYNTAKDLKTINRGDDDWYKFCSIVINDLKEDDTDIELLLEFLISHIMEEQPYGNMLKILNYSDTLNNDDPIEKQIIQYIDRNTLKDKNTSGIILQHDGKRKILIKNKDTGKWLDAKGEDIEDLKVKIGLMLSNLKPAKEKLNNLIGFITTFKNDYMTFKVKDFANKRTKGARCDQSTKRDAVKTLNEILGQEKYDSKSEISQKQICCIQEFLLRIYDRDKKNNKRWFLTPAESVLIDIESLKF
jgi:hypothetical protein